VLLGRCEAAPALASFAEQKETAQGQKSWRGWFSETKRGAEPALMRQVCWTRGPVTPGGQERSGSAAEARVGSLRYGQADFSQHLLHILPDTSAVFRGVVSQQVRGMICRHQFHGWLADAGIVFMELAA
jgi:hypothetical protein